VNVPISSELLSIPTNSSSIQVTNSVMHSFKQISRNIEQCHTAASRHSQILQSSEQGDNASLYMHCRMHLFKLRSRVVVTRRKCMFCISLILQLQGWQGAICISQSCNPYNPEQLRWWAYTRHPSDIMTWEPNSYHSPIYTLWIGVWSPHRP
jgi:hypothetical protein